MSKSILIALMVLVMIATALTACATPAEPTATPVPSPSQPEEVIYWKMFQQCASLAETDIGTRTWCWPHNSLALAEKLNHEADGRLVVEVMTPAELGLKGTEACRALKDNLINLAELGMSHQVKENPWLGAIDLPFIIREPYLEQMKIAMAVRPYLDKWAAQYDFKIYHLSRVHSLPYLGIFSKYPITTMDDLKGLKLRVYHPYQESLFKEAGATPIFMPYSEVPMAIAQGVVDGCFTSCGLGSQMKLHESGIKYETGIYPGVVMCAISVSNKSYEALPEDLQQLVDEVMEWYYNMNTAHQYNAVFGWEMLQADEELGLAITPPMPELAGPLEEYAKRTSWAVYEEENGALGTEFLDVITAALGRPR